MILSAIKQDCQQGKQMNLNGKASKDACIKSALK